MASAATVRQSSLFKASSGGEPRGQVPPLTTRRKQESRSSSPPQGSRNPGVVASWQSFQRSPPLSVQPLTQVRPEAMREPPPERELPAGDSLSDALLFLAAHHGRALSR